MPRLFGYEITSAEVIKGPFTLLDNQASPVIISSYAVASVSYVQLQYSLIRNSQTVTGRIMISTDGVSTVSLTDDQDGSTLGITFSASLSAGNLNLQYVSTSTGFDATMKYYEKSWQ